MYLKNHIKMNQNISSFYLEKYFNLIKKEIISSEKWEILVIISMFMLTRSSERIFTPSRYTDVKKTWKEEKEIKNKWRGARDISLSETEPMTEYLWRLGVLFFLFFSKPLTYTEWNYFRNITKLYQFFIIMHFSV